MNENLQGQLIYDKGSKTMQWGEKDKQWGEKDMQWGKDSFLNNGAVKTEKLYAK